MGVPAFFRWLSRKYTSIVVEKKRGSETDFVFDNLYLDMNGIIHPCTHPEDKAPPETEEEMFIAIQEYIEIILKMVRPQKLLYMAVDGVAPRAKMNQQRSRRFRASQESQDKADQMQKIIDNLRSKQVDVDSFDKKAHFDSNVITPGTQFMINLSISLRKWIDEKLSPEVNDPLWPKDLVIILSDASVPGEGEHKIMDYIRKQKAQETYNHNLTHCLLGADADLIMLGLATHEMNFTILREEFVPNQPKPCEICAQYGHFMEDCDGEARNPEEPEVTPTAPGFVFIRLNVLREYLEKEAEGLDLERFIDDFVFLCFFVGNDFLPHLPSLEIREGAIDRLLNIYRDVMGSYRSPVYLTENGIVNLKETQKILTILGQREDNIFQQRKESDKRYKERQKRQRFNGGGFAGNRGGRNRPKAKFRSKTEGWLKAETIESRGRIEGGAGRLREEATALRMQSGSTSDRLDALAAANDEAPSSKRKRDEDESDSDPDDDVQLGMEGWKERYYFRKFDCAVHGDISSQVAREYVKGLCWVLLYYYQGCPDWQWFYPYHYAPFASDFKNIDQVEVKFDRDVKPFKPLEQLMSVFPAASSQNLPISWRRLMSDPKSSIIDFYPSQFAIDLNGKSQAWMGVALLPFIDEQRLHLALKDVYPDLTEEEKERNSLGPHLVFISRDRAASYPFLRDYFEGRNGSNEEEKQLDPEDFDSMAGIIHLSKKYSQEYKNTFCVEYYDPKYDPSFIFPAIRHPAAKAPPKQLKPHDYVGQYRPTIGFEGPNSSRPQASLGLAGHRMVDSGTRYRHQSPQADPNSRFVQGFQQQQQPQQQQQHMYPRQQQPQGNFLWDTKWTENKLPVMDKQ